jgi:ankyrin repeat protein
MRHFLFFAGMGLGLLGSACVPRPASKLAEAAGRNDTETLQALLSAAHPSEDELHAVLVWAARHGAPDAIALLIAAGADVNRADISGNRWSPLQHAVHTQQPRAVEALLASGAKPDAAAPGGATALFMAADSLDPTIVTLLLEAGANPRVVGPGGRTPLTQAVSGGALWDVTDRPLLGGCRPATVRALLAAAPDLRLPDTPAGHQALWWARMHDCEDVIALVGANPTVPGQKAVAAVGIIREQLGVPRPKDVLRDTRATDDPSRR